MAKDETAKAHGAGDRLARATHELAAARAEYQEQTGESPYGLLNLHPAPAGEVIERAREILKAARKEYAGEGRVDLGGYEPVLARHMAAALEGVDAEALEARRRGDGLAHDLAQARADLQDQTDENEKARIQLERAEASDEEQGDAEDTITVAKETRRIVRAIHAWLVEQEDEPRTCEPGEGKDRALPDDFPYAPGPRPEIPGTERILAGLPAEGGEPDWPKIAVAEDSAFLRGGRAPYEKPTVVPWEVRFAELVGERVTLRDRVDELLASNSLEIQKRRHAEVRRDDWESAHQAQKEIAVQAASDLARANEDAQKGAETACDLFDKQYAILSRYRLALMRCRDHSGPVDQIVREALEGPVDPIIREALEAEEDE